MKKKFVALPEWVKFVIVMAVIIGFGWITVSKVLLIDQNPVKETQEQPNPKMSQQKLKIGSSEIMTEVRKTNDEQELGLSWRQSMGDNEGMIFIYPSPQRVSYWMKGMQFPLDFIFVANNKVVELVKRVAQPTKDNPAIEIISPKAQVDMVIEVNAGWVESHQVKVGDEVKL